jgi:integrase
VPIETERLRRLIDAAPDHVRAMIVLGAGAGLRKAEVFGLTLDRVDFLRREVRGDRQLAGTDAEDEPRFGAPKTGASVRTVPLPQAVVDELAAHVAAMRVDGKIAPDALLFRDSAGRPWRRNRWAELWRPLTGRLELDEAGFHDLRHYYAALLIRRGASVKTVQDRLGHKSAVTTLDTYGHLWPDSDDETRAAIDAELGQPGGSVVRGIVRA